MNGDHPYYFEDVAIVHGPAALLIASVLPSREEFLGALGHDDPVIREAAVAAHDAIERAAKAAAQRQVGNGVHEDAGVGVSADAVPAGGLAGPMESPWATVAEAAGLQRVHESTIRRRVRAGKLAYNQPGGKGTAIRIPRYAVQPPKES